jgi:putative redox protein
MAMAHALTATVRLVAGDHFDTVTGSGGEVTLAPASETAPTGAVSPMEALLVALGGCLGMVIAPMLARMRQRVTRYEIVVSGALTERPPRVFEQITVEHYIAGERLELAAIERALTLAETRYCGVSAMLGKAAQISHRVTLSEE